MLEHSLDIASEDIKILSKKQLEDYSLFTKKKDKEGGISFIKNP
jgi:hypothetical protein